MSGKRAKQLRAAEKAIANSPKRQFPKLATILLPFTFGVVLTAGGFLIYPHISKPKQTFQSSSFNSADAGRRTVCPTHGPLRRRVGEG